MEENTIGLENIRLAKCSSCPDESLPTPPIKLVPRAPTIERRRSNSDLLPNEKKTKRKKIRVGICAMDKKVESKQMNEILKKFGSTFEIVRYGNKVLQEDPIELWPQVDCLIAFFSDGFPLEKAIEYAKRTNPYLVNDLEMQRVLFDRRKVYEILQSIGIRTPNHIIVDRDDIGKPGYQEPLLEEAEDYIIYDGIQMQKPFVEKPVDAEDHNIYIYYPVRLGGGSKRLFRKVGDRASEFYKHETMVRRDRSYIYEEFVSTQGTDVKVYTVGPNYAHSEARKSPTVDGKVNRDQSGKEIRYPVILSEEEKLMAQKITHAFKQKICGFDILRYQDTSYVCDVNGWSFVKGNSKYYQDCAQLLKELMLGAVYPDRFMAEASAVGPMYKCLVPRQPIPMRFSSSQIGSFDDSPLTILEETKNDPSKDHSPKTLRKMFAKSCSNFQGGDSNMQAYYDFGGMAHQRGSEIWKFQDLEERESFDIPVADGQNLQPPSLKTHTSEEKTTQPTETAELRCVMAVIRHGDRTPKQKLKIKVEYKEYLEFHRKYSTNPRNELKCKEKTKLREFLTITRTLVAKLQENEEECKTELEKLLSIQDVLERWEFSGINRKVQLKPTRWDFLALAEQAGAGGGEGQSEKVTQVQLVVKWGGELTALGETQAEKLGSDFRVFMYPDPGKGGGLLRLHSTFRHDLKIRTSNEGRVMKTAAAFTKGLLELEGDLTPILVSLVHKEDKSLLLDGSGDPKIKAQMERCKSTLTAEMQTDLELTEQDLTYKTDSIKATIKKIGNPKQALCKIRELTQSLVAQLSDIQSGNPDIELYQGETMTLMLNRWVKLERELYSSKTEKFDLSKVPDVYDNIRYDALHNSHLGLKDTKELFERVKAFSDVIVPQEFGIDKNEKRIIGRMTCNNLLMKIHDDLILARQQDDKDLHFKFDESHAKEHQVNTIGRRVRTRLYFTSESHLHTLINCLRYPDSEKPLIRPKAAKMLDGVQELSYLTMVVFRLYEDPMKGVDDPTRFRVEILFTPGVINPPKFEYSHQPSQPGASDPDAVDVVQCTILHKKLVAQDVVDCFKKMSHEVPDGNFLNAHFINTSPKKTATNCSANETKETEIDDDKLVLAEHLDFSESSDIEIEVADEHSLT